MVRTDFTSAPQSPAQVTALENELDAAHAALDASNGAQPGSTSTLSSRAVQAKAAAEASEARAAEAASALEAAEASRARLAEDNEKLQERVSAMQAQVGLTSLPCGLGDHDRPVRGDVSVRGTMDLAPHPLLTGHAPSGPLEGAQSEAGGRRGAGRMSVAWSAASHSPHTALDCQPAAGCGLPLAVATRRCALHTLG